MEDWLEGSHVNLHSILSELSQKRPVFHNEADFQHALAWEIREHYNDAKIRLETKVLGANTKVYLDILVQSNEKKYAIELKYKSRYLDCIIDGEEYVLNYQGAQDIGRYDVLKDLQRLENMVGAGVVDEGYLIFLTNDASYYTDPGVEKQTVDRDFRLHEGRRLSGVLSWAEQTGMGTMKGRKEPITLQREYEVRWSAYSQVSDTSSGEFRCLCLPVRGIPVQKRIAQTSPAVTEKPQPVINACPVEADSLFQSFAKRGEIPTSQADLRDKLAAHLRTLGYSINVNRALENEKVDIWAEKNGEHLAIEVRYKTALLQTIYEGTEIHLKNQAAHDISRYDFIRDLSKLEKIVEAIPDVKGFALLLTNDRVYWQPPRKHDSVDKDFHLYDGRILTGICKWGDLASPGTTLGREEPIHLTRTYQLKWQPYLQLGMQKNQRFEALLIEVNYD